MRRYITEITFRGKHADDIIKNIEHACRVLLDKRVKTHYNCPIDCEDCKYVCIKTHTINGVMVNECAHFKCDDWVSEKCAFRLDEIFDMFGLFTEFQNLNYRNCYLVYDVQKGVCCVPGKTTTIMQIDESAPSIEIWNKFLGSVNDYDLSFNFISHKIYDGEITPIDYITNMDDAKMSVTFGYRLTPFVPDKGVSADYKKKTDKQYKNVRMFFDCLFDLLGRDKRNGTTLGDNFVSGMWYVNNKEEVYDAIKTAIGKINLGELSVDCTSDFDCFIFKLADDCRIKSVRFNNISYPFVCPIMYFENPVNYDKLKGSEE